MDKQSVGCGHGVVSDSSATSIFQFGLGKSSAHLLHSLYSLLTTSPRCLVVLQVSLIPDFYFQVIRNFVLSIHRVLKDAQWRSPLSLLVMTCLYLYLDQIKESC